MRIHIAQRLRLFPVDLRIVIDSPREATLQHRQNDYTTVSLKEERAPIWYNAVWLLISVTAGVVAFLPLALYTSPWDAVTFRVPENQGNWWHLLIGAPFFLAFPMIWLRLRSLFSGKLSTPPGRRLIWTVVALSICGTILVDVPFLLRLGNLARMNEWRRLSILCPTFGIVIASGALLFLRRHNILPTRACLVGLSAAYLANAALCLIVYGPMPGTAGSRSGWIVTIVIVWPMLLELVWLFIFIQTFKTQESPDNSRADQYAARPHS